jgi:hypothetical protein
VLPRARPRGPWGRHRHGVGSNTGVPEPSARVRPYSPNGQARASDDTRVCAASGALRGMALPQPRPRACLNAAPGWRRGPRQGPPPRRDRQRAARASAPALEAAHCRPGRSGGLFGAPPGCGDGPDRLAQAARPPGRPAATACTCEGWAPPRPVTWPHGGASAAVHPPRAVSAPGAPSGPAHGLGGGGHSAARGGAPSTARQRAWA